MCGYVYITSQSLSSNLPWTDPKKKKKKKTKQKKNKKNKLNKNW
jgi:hypothetical protein